MEVTMGRRKKWPPVPHSHRASGQERVRVNGHDVYLGPIGSPEAKRAYALLLVRLAAQEAPEPARTTTELTVAEVVLRWDEEALLRYDPAGDEPYQFRRALGPLLVVCGTLPIGQLSLVRLEDTRDEMVRRGWSRGVVNRRIRRIRQVVRWAERRGHVPAGTWAALAALGPLPRGDRRCPEAPRRKAVAWADLAATCRQADRRIRAMLLLGWYTGMRPGETRRMRAGEIDVTAALWVYRPGKHKMEHHDQERVVILGPIAQKVLGPFLAGKKPDEWLFPSRRTGQPLSRVSYSRLVQQAKLRAGASGPVIAHGCRHAARQRITRELGLDHARALLGQTSLQTTDNYAAGQDLEMARAAARQMG
jgi:integrase